MFYCHAIELNTILTNLLHVSPVIKDNTQILGFQIGVFLSVFFKIPHLLIHHSLFHIKSTILHSSSFIPDLLIYHPSFKTSLFLILNPTSLHSSSFILYLIPILPQYNFTISHTFIILYFILHV